MLSVIAVVIGLGMIVFFHELGHFLVSKAVGLPVERFSVGFPPFLFRKTAAGTEYCIGSVPLGGYVKVDLGVGTEAVSPVVWWKRAMVVLAGPAMNLVLAGVLMFVVLGVVGTEVPVVAPVVGSEHMSGLQTGDVVLQVSGVPVERWSDIVELLEQHQTGEYLVLRAGDTLSVPFNLKADSIPGFSPLIPPVVECPVGLPAYEAGMRTGDSIVSVNGHLVVDFSELQQEVRRFDGEHMGIVYMRTSQPDTAWLKPIEYQGSNIIGVTSMGKTEVLRLPLGTAIVLSVTAAVQGGIDFFSTLAEMASKPSQLAEMSGGPVFVAETLDQQAGLGLSRFLETIAYFSLAIMGFNLLPLPVLDGGQFLFILFEGVRGRPAPGRVVQIAQQVGVLLLLVLFSTVIYKDIVRVVTRVG